MMSTGYAPCAARPCRSASTFARYWVFVGDHGVASADPNSSFNPIQGAWQAVDATAFAYRESAAAASVAASAGVAGCPTTFGRWRTKYAVAAPFDWKYFGTAV